MIHILAITQAIKELVVCIVDFSDFGTALVLVEAELPIIERPSTQNFE
jgi:hypothetical protein